MLIAKGNNKKQLAHKLRWFTLLLAYMGKFSCIFVCSIVSCNIAAAFFVVFFYVFALHFPLIWIFEMITLFDVFFWFDVTSNHIISN